MTRVRRMGQEWPDIVDMVGALNLERQIIFPSRSPATARPRSPEMSGGGPEFRDALRNLVRSLGQDAARRVLMAGPLSINRPPADRLSDRMQ